jgi:hypothetical protein
MIINSEEYKISDKNYYKSEHDKTQIILAGSLRKSNYHIVHLRRKDYGLTKTWNTYTITREGNIYEHYNPKYYSDFMGVKEIDKKSISIVLENMGMLYFDYDSNNFLNWSNDICPENNVFEKNWKGCRYWEAYTKEQFNATVNLCDYLSNKFQIKMDCLGYNSHHEDTINYEGIVTRSNYDIDYFDLNPSFDFKKFLHELDIPLQDK